MVTLGIRAIFRRRDGLVYIVDEYIHNGGSAISTQRAFRIRFQFDRRDSVPDRKTMLV